MGHDKFIAEHLIFGMSQCMACAHFLEPFRCKAYPEGIPIKIAANEFMHDVPLLGDRGYRYKPKEQS